MTGKEIRSLTGLRGVAAWWVVLYHFQAPLLHLAGDRLLAFLEQGYLAVDLFFILSGLVIFVNYGAKFSRIKQRDVISFYVRRVARIYPLYIFVLALFIANPLAIKLYSQSKAYQDRYDVDYFFMSVFLVQNWGFTSALKWNIAAWSISTEIAAYICFPYIAYIFMRLFNRSDAAIALVAVVLVLAIDVTYYSLGYTKLGDDIPSIGLFRCLTEFSLGMVSGFVYQRKIWLQFKAPFLFLLSGFVLLSAYLAGMANYVYVPTAFFLIIVGLTRSDGSVSGFLGSGPLYYLGEISYSTYLVHVLAKDWVKFLSDASGLGIFVIYLALVFFASIVLYNLVERPGRVWFSRVLCNKLGVA